MAEHIFFQHDFQVGEKEFDRKFFIKVEDKGWGNTFFNERIIRASIASILSNGFHRIYLEDMELKADFYIKILEDCPSIEIIKDTVANLEQVIAVLNKIDSQR